MQVPNGTGPGVRRSKRPLLRYLRILKVSQPQLFDALGGVFNGPNIIHITIAEGNFTVLHRRSKKQKSCSPWCPWSQVQQDTSGPDNFRILGCLWTIHHRCTCKWDSTEMLTVSLPLRATTAWNPLRIQKDVGEKKKMSARKIKSVPHFVCGKLRGCKSKLAKWMF